MLAMRVRLCALGRREWEGEGQVVVRIVLVVSIRSSFRLVVLFSVDHLVSILQWTVQSSQFSTHSSRRNRSMDCFVSPVLTPQSIHTCFEGNELRLTQPYKAGSTPPADPPRPAAAPATSPPTSVPRSRSPPHRPTGPKRLCSSHLFRRETRHTPRCPGHRVVPQDRI